jgi:hypothetical protein
MSSRKSVAFYQVSRVINASSDDKKFNFSNFFNHRKPPTSRGFTCGSMDLSIILPVDLLACSFQISGSFSANIQTAFCHILQITSRH